MEKWAQAVSALIVLVVGFSAVGWWQGRELSMDLRLQVPGMDRSDLPTEDDNGGPGVTVVIGNLFEAGEGRSPSVLPGADWPGFRGSDGLNIVEDGVRLADDWEATAPEVLWTVDLGEGHAGPAVVDGRVYVIDYDEERQADMLRCLSLEDGSEIWRRGYQVAVRRNHGMSRTVPAVAHGVVVTMGPRCHVMAVAADSGDFLWGLDLEREFGAPVPLWYTGQCPLIDDRTVVLAPSGEHALMIGLDLRTGNVLWTTPNPDGWRMSHASVVVANLAGSRVYVYTSLDGIVGVATGDAKAPAGSVLWRSTEWRNNVIAPSPLALDDSRLLVTAGYGGGGALLRITSTQDGTLDVMIEDRWSPREGLCSEQQTPVLFYDRIMAVLPKDAGARRQELMAVDSSNPRRLLWLSGRTERFGLGPYLVADEKLLLLNDDGVLSLIDARAAEFKLLGRFKVMDGHDAWGPMALVGRRLLLRDDTRMVCLELPGDGG